MAGKKILLDAPSSKPALGYAGIARALAGVISKNEPNFAIGIFGGWGSGKTTLMRAVSAALLPAEGVVVADFNAWGRARATVAGPAARRDQDGGSGVRSHRRRALAGSFARLLHVSAKIIRVLASGLSISAAPFKYDVKAALDVLAGSRDEEPKSLYAAAFGELRSTFTELKDVGVSRLVVFVDDLDRCLPAAALDVLESMKLFFDFPGFIFVVGMDEAAIDRAITTKPGAPALLPGDRPGREYAKKIFQISYTLPFMRPEQLDHLLPSMYTDARIEGEQLSDLRERVGPT